MAREMILELQLKAEEHSRSGWIVAYDPGVLKSDTVVPNDVKLALQEGIKPLENVPEAAKDWHPGSNDQVLDLVHPSLWPLMYGISKRVVDPQGCNNDDLLANIGTGTIMSVDEAELSSWQYSKHFQWLPAEIRYTNEKEVKYARIVEVECTENLPMAGLRAISITFIHRGMLIYTTSSRK